MNEPNGPAAPASGTTSDPMPSIEQLAADPEIAALLEFEPAPVEPRPNGWDPQAQRALVALIAMTGSKGRAAGAIGRKTGGLKRIFDRDSGAAFKHAVDAALDLYRRRHGIKLVHGLTAAAAARSAELEPPLGPAELDVNGNPQGEEEVLNELGEWEDERSYRERAEEAKHSICGKLLRIRRLFLQEISGSPGKRAAFEILTELPIDWTLAAEGEPQPDEPWRRPNQREPDMIVMAESGWSFGEYGYGPDRKAEARRALDAERAERGMEPVDWEGE
jgi:hypothetical protein